MVIEPATSWNRPLNSKHPYDTFGERIYFSLTASFPRRYKPIDSVGLRQRFKIRDLHELCDIRGFDNWVKIVGSANGVSSADLAIGVNSVLLASSAVAASILSTRPRCSFH